MNRRLLVLLVAVACLPAICFAQQGKVKDLLTEVNSPEIFLKPEKYVAFTGLVTVRFRTDANACRDVNGQPIPHCVVLEPQPNATPFDVQAIAEVTIPGKTLQDIICINSRFGPDARFQNQTAGDDVAVFAANATLTLESDVLNDPRALDDDGQPLNGSLTFGGTNRRLVLTLAPGHIFEDRAFWTRHGCLLRTATFGFLPDDLVKRLFDTDMRLKLNITGNARLVTFANVTHGAAILGH